MARKRVRHTEKAHAKVNLVLRVGGKRPDGYHEVATVLQMLHLHDLVHIEAEGPSGGQRHGGQPHGSQLYGGQPKGTQPRERRPIGLDSPLCIDVSCDSPQVPGGEGNLAWQAVRLLEPELVQSGYDAVKIHIEKKIPVAAGLAGGSTDAAAVLRGLVSRLTLPVSAAELLRRAARLGADVPACLMGGTVLGIGRGDEVSPIASRTFWWVLANPGGALTAKEVYAALSAMRSTDTSRPTSPLPDLDYEFRRALVEGDAGALARCLHNDLQRPVCRLHAGVASLMERMKPHTLACIVSGSGPTVAGLMRGPDEALTLATALKDVVPWVWWGESEVQHGPIAAYSAQ